MRTGSIEHFNQSFIVGNTIYDFAAQISYHDNEFLNITDCTRNHFYSRVKINSQYFKFDGKFCTEKTKSANPEKVMLAVYKVRGSTKNLGGNQDYIYDTKALAFFRRSTEKYKETDRESKRAKYHENETHKDEVLKKKKRKVQRRGTGGKKGVV